MPDIDDVILAGFAEAGRERDTQQLEVAVAVMKRTGEDPVRRAGGSREGCCVGCHPLPLSLEVMSAVSNSSAMLMRPLSPLNEVCVPTRSFHVCLDLTNSFVRACWCSAGSAAFATAKLLRHLRRYTWDSPAFAQM
jgi:hypothetical protein